MSSSRVLLQTQLIAVFVTVMAVAAWPASAAAQNCGYCYNHVFFNTDFHSFDLLGYLFVCDKGGCHPWVVPKRCNEWHAYCYLEPLGSVESAIAKRNAPDFEEFLASSDNWDYATEDRTLSLKCSGYTVAVYVLPAESAKVATTIWSSAKRASAQAGTVSQSGS